MHTTTSRPATQAGPYQPTSTSDALVHAEQIGCDGIYGGENLADALRDTAARWEAEGAMARLEAAGLTTRATR